MIKFSFFLNDLVKDNCLQCCRRRILVSILCHATMAPTKKNRSNMVGRPKSAHRRIAMIRSWCARARKVLDVWLPHRKYTKLKRNINWFDRILLGNYAALQELDAVRAWSEQSEASLTAKMQRYHELVEECITEKQELLVEVSTKCYNLIFCQFSADAKIH
jgi:hypothetical protein